MPYVLLHKETSEIFTCKLINIYDFPYHGTKFWEVEEDAEQEMPSFLAGQGVDPTQWTLLEVEEERLKVFNVKLKNDPQYRLFLNEDGRPIAKKL